MAIKRKGIVARPGVFNDEVVTADMLRRMIQFQNRIPLIVGPHPVGGYSKPSDWVGTVGNLEWNDEEQAVDGDYWFFDEEWHRVPNEVQDKVVNYRKVNASQGYDTEVNDHKEQVWRKWDHIALGIPNPLIPDIGVNVRMESKFPNSFRSESSAEISAKDDEKKQPPAEQTEHKLELTPAQLQAVIDRAVQQALDSRLEPPQEEAQEEPVEQQKTEKAPVAKETRPAPVPEVVLPASAPSSSKKDKIEEVDGWWKL